LIAWPTKLSAFISGSLFSISDIVLTVSRNWAKTIILEFGSFWNWFLIISFRVSSFGCSMPRVVASVYALAKHGSLTSFCTPLDFCSAACWKRFFR